jgi:hypothetical protein
MTDSRIQGRLVQLEVPPTQRSQDWLQFLRET